MWKVAIVPALMSFFYFPLVFLGSIFGFGEVGMWLNENLMWEPMQSPWTAAILAIVLGAVGLYVAFLVFRNVIMILYTPFLGFLSETAEKKEYGYGGPEFSFKGLAYEIYRGILVSLITLAWSLMLMVVCWLFLLVPVVGGLMSIVGLTLVQMYFAGVGFADPAMERRRYSVRESLSFAWRHRARLLGCGAGFVLILLIPLIGWLLAPTYGVIAGTLSAADILGPRIEGEGVELEERDR